MLFESLSFQLEAGEMLQVSGVNGSGKTTLLRTLMGLFTPVAGEIDWNLERPPLFLGHRAAISDRLTVLENLAWLCRLQEIDATESALDAALDRVDLAGYQETPASQLSAGQRRRVSLALLYVSENPCWILDEPFTALDARGCEQIEDRMNQHLLEQGVVILTSHQPLSRETRQLVLSP